MAFQLPLTGTHSMSRFTVSLPRCVYEVTRIGDLGNRHTRCLVVMEPLRSPFSQCPDSVA